jgi:hypothetical protein
VRQLAELPRTEEALARGEIGYQHAVAMARSAEQIGSVAVRKAEATLLQAAQTMDPGGGPAGVTQRKLLSIGLMPTSGAIPRSVNRSTA